MQQDRAVDRCNCCGEKTNELNKKTLGTEGAFYSEARPFATSGLVSLSLPQMLSACATEAEFLAQNAPSDMKTALTRGRFELDCPEAKATVLSQKVTYINGMGIGLGGGGYEWTEYTIGVKGCGKTTVYETLCRDQSNCNAFAQTGSILEGGW